MAFVLKRHADFEFALEDDQEKTYVIPNVSKLSFEEAQLMAKFGDENSIVKQGKLQGDFPVAVLKVDMTNLDYASLDARLSHVIRNEDFVGVGSHGVYILLPDADSDVTAMVQERLQGAGVATAVCEAVD